MTERLNQNALDFILNHTKSATENQLHDAEILDTKMVQVFAAASVVIGLVGFRAGIVIIDRRILYVLVGALIVYAAVGVSMFMGLRIRSLRRTFQADTLWPNYWQDNVVGIQHALVQDICDAYAFNKRELDKKSQAILIGLTLTGFEVILIGVFLIWSLLA